MASSLKRVGWGLALACLVHASSACTPERVVGDQCPGPRDPGAVVEGDPDPDQTVFGTRCPPCDREAPLDPRGCPIFVTFQSCGGDICIGDQRVSPATRDAGAADASDARDASEESDAGEETDSGATEDSDAG